MTIYKVLHRLSKYIYFCVKKKVDILSESRLLCREIKIPFLLLLNIRVCVFIRTKKNTRSFFNINAYNYFKYYRVLRYRDLRSHDVHFIVISQGRRRLNSGSIRSPLISLRIRNSAHPLRGFRTIHVATWDVYRFLATFCRAR